MKEAMFYKTDGEGLIICELCPHRCRISEGGGGKCGVREVVNGKLYASNYGKVSSMAIDPIEKKPIHRWHSGSKTLSFGTFGCNMTCQFCQNFVLSQQKPDYTYMSPEEVVKEAERLGLESIAYTYNEPSVYYEMVYETAKLAKERGLFNVMVTNGFLNEKPLKKLLPLIDAINVDVKTYNNSIYKNICGGALEPVLNTLQFIVASGVHLEITCLLVPGLFDDLGEVEKLFKKIRGDVGNIPVHLSRYFPRYQYGEPPTDIGRMLEIQYLALKYFSYVKLGNVY